MKKIAKIGIVLIVLLTGFSKVSNAYCDWIPIICPCGGGSNAWICADNAEDWQKAVREAYEVICGEQPN